MDGLAAVVALVIAIAFFSLMALVAWLNGMEEDEERAPGNFRH